VADPYELVLAVSRPSTLAHATRLRVEALEAARWRVVGGVRRRRGTLGARVEAELRSVGLCCAVTAVEVMAVVRDAV
jgi:hypothetical protein